MLEWWDTQLGQLPDGVLVGTYSRGVASPCKTTPRRARGSSVALALYDAWDSCTCVVHKGTADRRLHAVQGPRAAYGFWRHMKHGYAVSPVQVHRGGQRLDMYCQSLVWHMHWGGCPYRDTLRACRAFRSLPCAATHLAFRYGLTCINRHCNQHVFQRRRMPHIAVVMR